jgi:hypothetical protein
MTKRTDTPFNRGGGTNSRRGGRPSGKPEVRHTDDDRARLVEAFIANGGRVRRFEPKAGKLEVVGSHIPEPDWAELDY